MIVEISNLYGKTLKKPPAKEYIDSFKLLIRGGFVKVLKDNSFVFTTTLNKSIENLSNLIKDHFHDFSVASIFPVFSNNLLLEFIDSEINSYKQLPQRTMYQTNRSNPNYSMKQGMLYSQNSLIMGYCDIQASNEIEQIQTDLEVGITGLFDSLNLKIDKYNSITKNDTNGNISKSYDFSILSDHGKHEYVICTKCAYKANREVAVIHKKENAAESESELSEVETPDSTTIAHLAQYLGIPESKCAKAVFYSFKNQDASKLALVIIRGDMEVNEFRIKHLLRTDILKVASDDEIRNVGCVPGFASAIGINKELCTVIVDDLIPKSKNLVAGANKVDYHLLNTNYERDYTADIVSDIALAMETSLCPNCQSNMDIQLGIPLCQLTVDTENKSISYLNDKGKPLTGGWINFEFDMTRIIGMLALNFDKFGVKFPTRISPFQIAIITIGSESEVKELGNKLHDDLSLHFNVLYDNRDVKLGVKLNDTDLRSIPFRLIISRSSIENDEIELSKRGSNEKRYFKLENALSELDKMKEISLRKSQIT